jgi:hypothetical protein
LACPGLPKNRTSTELVLELVEEAWRRKAPAGLAAELSQRRS